MTTCLDTGVGLNAISKNFVENKGCKILERSITPAPVQVTLGDSRQTIANEAVSVNFQVGNCNTEL